MTFTATVVANAPGSGTPTGSVTFMNGSTTLGTVTLSDGTASYSTAKLATGTDTITATYNGSSSFTTSSASLDQTVNQDASHDDRHLVAQSLGLRPVGDVHGDGDRGLARKRDADGDGDLQGRLDGRSARERSAAARRRSRPTALPAGSQSITAVYGGDTNFVTSTSAVLTQTVNQDATTTKVTSSANPSVYGQSVTFTATVTAAAPGSGTPTGTVDFYDGTTALGTGTLGSTGTATFTTSAFAVGTNAITAVYSGDANFTTSTSSTLNQTVTQTAQAVTADLVAQLVDSALDALTSDDTSEDGTVIPTPISTVRRLRYDGPPGER